MVIVMSIIAGLVVAFLAYRILFSDFGDFLGGYDWFQKDNDRWVWQRPRIAAPEDENWLGGIRFIVWLAVSVGCGWLCYELLQKVLS
jgi:hypothetical protein